MTLRQPLTTEQVQSMIRRVAETCPTTAAAIERVGLPETRAQTQGIGTFLRVICGQQLSVKAAASIWARVEAHFEGDFAPMRLLDLEPEGWRKLGLSGQKTRYIHGLANALVEGSFRPDELPGMEDAEALAHITALKGFGTWSAEIYLLFAEGRSDMFP
ncbi:MAG: DNA-3-methyladenine glycosylase 2 family protein, partial [Pseudomonadota bacterium]|nr:DNA-3-methyladenine glycosylase 2 family protein [Pseudomonadota bacterium]